MYDHTPIGITNWRNTNQPFYIKDQDRLGHIYVIGKTGVGKSTLLTGMAVSDIHKGKGICVIDPHGDMAENVLNYISEERIDDVIYFNPKDLDYPIAFNPLKAVHPNNHHIVASGLISTFKKIWADSWGPRLEYILKFSLLTLLEYPHATLLDIQPLLTDHIFREKILRYIKNHHTLSFWRNEFDKYSPQLRSDAITAILNKTGVFLSSIPLRNCVGQKTNGIRMQQVLDEGKILIVNLSKGEIGEDTSTLFGSIIITSIQLAALSRAGIPEHLRKPFFLYVDEMHSFVSLSFIDILSEARKYRLSLCMAHQYIDQVDERIRSAIFGNAGTFISFRIGAQDAEHVAKELYPTFNEYDLIHLEKYHMYLKMMIDGATSAPFSAITVKVEKPAKSFKQDIIYRSRQQFATQRYIVEKKIFERYRKSAQRNINKSLFE